MQPWLLPYKNPLRFTPEFYRSIPRNPGVYLMKGPRGEILYIGKAKDLRARLSSYRRAKPDQVSRKVIRMLNLIRVIEWEECPTEELALLRENALLREHRPPFNVVNTQPETYLFFALALSSCESGRSRVTLRLTSQPGDATSEEIFGTFKGRGLVRNAFQAMLRLVWISQTDPDSESYRRFEFPAPLIRRNPPEAYSLLLPDASWIRLIRGFLKGTSRTLLAKLTETLLLHEEIPPFMYRLIQEDLEILDRFFVSGPHRNKRLRKAHGLRSSVIRQEEIDDLLVTYRNLKK